MCFVMVCFSCSLEPPIATRFLNGKVIMCHHCQGLGLQVCFALIPIRLNPPSQLWFSSESPSLVYTEKPPTKDVFIKIEQISVLSEKLFGNVKIENYYYYYYYYYYICYCLYAGYLQYT